MHCLKLCLNSDKPHDSRITLNQLAVVARAEYFIHLRKASVRKRQECSTAARLKHCTSHLGL